jgi:hypothetical protein
MAIGPRSRYQHHALIAELVVSGRVRRLQGSRGLILTDPQASEVDAPVGE